jgi:hypothetical protein
MGVGRVLAMIARYAHPDSQPHAEQGVEGGKAQEQSVDGKQHDPPV